MKKQCFFTGGLAFVITLAVLTLTFLMGGLYPFGDGTVAWCDMEQQLIPLFCDFKDILDGKESMFLNFSNAGGMNFYGVFFFFLASPFTFAVAFVEKTDIPFLMNILVALKLAVSGFTAGFVIKRLQKNLSCLTAASLGLAYALGGYGMLFYQNIMWLDIMYLFPFVILGIRSLIRDNRPIMLTVALSLTVIMNFYLSFMVFLFVIFFFGIFALSYRSAPRRIYVNLALCGITSLLVSAFVWLPCLLQYTSSARGVGFLEELKKASFFAPYETSLVVLLCSGMCLAGVVWAFGRLSTSQKEDKLLLLSFFITALPLVIEPVNLMWHTGSYMSFPARYGFIPLFLATLITAREISKLTQGDGEIKHYRKKLILIPLFLILPLLGFLFARENAVNLCRYVATLWNDTRSFLGLLFICGFFFAATLLLFAGIWKKLLFKKAFGLLLCITVVLGGLSSAELYIAPAKQKFNDVAFQGVMKLEEKAEKTGFYRVNLTSKKAAANMTGAAGLNSLGHYTSLSDRTYMETAKAFGYSGYWMETGNWGGSILSDTLLSVGYTVHMENQDYILKEAPYFCGLGIKAKGEIPKSLPKGDRLTALGEAFAQMSTKINPVLKYDPISAEFCRISSIDEEYAIETLSSSGRIEYEINVTDPQTLYFDCYNGFSTRLTEDINNSFQVSVNGIVLTEDYPTQSLNGLLKVGSFENEVVDIIIYVNKSIECSSFGLFGIKEGVLEEYTKNVVSLNLRETTGKIEGKAQKGSYFISIPYKDNYKITLDGKKLEYNKALSGFIAVDVPQEGYLEIGFTPKGFWSGIVISALGVILLILAIVKRKKERVYNETLCGIVYGIFLGGCGATVLSVYIIPIIVNLADLRI